MWTFCVHTYCRKICKLIWLTRVAAFSSWDFFPFFWCICVREAAQLYNTNNMWQKLNVASFAWFVGLICFYTVDRMKRQKKSINLPGVYIKIWRFHLHLKINLIYFVTLLHFSVIMNGRGYWIWPKGATKVNSMKTARKLHSLMLISFIVFSN